MKKFKEVSKYNFARDIIFLIPVLCIIIVLLAILLVVLPIQVVRFILDSLVRIVERLEYLIIVVLKKMQTKYFKKD